MTQFMPILVKILMGIGIAALAPVMSFVWKTLSPDKKVDEFMRGCGVIISTILGKVRFINLIQTWVEYTIVRSALSLSLGLRKDNPNADNEELAKWGDEFAKELRKPLSPL